METPMSDEAALLLAIHAEPDDDTPRLVYADWLDEHGDPERAGFIRLQVERARAFPPGALEPKLSAREMGLLRKHARAWFEPPAGWKLDQQFLVQRGFPYAVTCNYHAYRDHQDVFVRWPITRLHPWLQAFDRESARCFAEVPLPANIRELDLYSSHAGPDVLRVLWAAPSLAGVLWLDVGCCRLGDVGATLLARELHMPRLRYLDLNYNSITGVGLRALAARTYCGSIESLTLSNNQVTADDVCAFLGSDRWTNLTDLCLWSLRLGDAGVTRLASCPALARLTVLNLNCNGITDDGVRALAASPHVCNLRTLSLATNELTPACADVLIGSPHLRDLKYLRLTNNTFERRDRRKFVARFGTGVSFKFM
jgi:uncharacterized protein (TIGR02996 family)